MHEIVIAKPSANNIPMSKTGKAQSICQEKGRPTSVRMTIKIKSVGRNLNIAITTADIGSMILGKAVLRISRWPAVIDLTPPVRELAIR
jgi:hypothetical protein